MNLNEFAKEIHANACAHGFWDKPDTFDKICADIISELSEALREYEAGRPMEWYHCDMEFVGNGMCEGSKCDFQKGEPCIAKGCKPEGIAVEMADCAIWILDYLGYKGYSIDEEPRIRPEDYKALPYAFMKVCMHIVDAHEHEDIGMDEVYEVWALERALRVILHWFTANDLDFEAIARRKHEYNKLRPYKHGKAF